MLTSVNDVSTSLNSPYICSKLGSSMKERDVKQGKVKL